MNAEQFLMFLRQDIGIDFYAGVPDSLLAPFIAELEKQYQGSNNHIITANEGSAVGLAAGYYMAERKIPCVYMQNSGQGNAFNPIISLLHQEVYKIPCLFVVGWRGEPGGQDEPQHQFQGKITREVMELAGIETLVLDNGTQINELPRISDHIKGILEEGSSFALIIRKNLFTEIKKIHYCNQFTIQREQAIENILREASEDVVICTTGKASRELFEIRERNLQTHKYDFLTVGSMGHCSSIALGIALFNPDKRVWCIDGDGAVLMHMGSLATIGGLKPPNLVHVIINNESHETVGGMPTAARYINFSEIAHGCGYPNVESVNDLEQLKKELHNIKGRKGLACLEIKTALGSRKDLGRPSTSPQSNKDEFMKYLAKK